MFAFPKKLNGITSKIMKCFANQERQEPHRNFILTYTYVKDMHYKRS